MQIKKIYLKNYRNYESLDIDLNSGINIFYGQNAQGKTNIIESVYLASTGKSHRTQKDSELIRWNSQDARVKIEFEKDNADKTVDIYLNKGFKKQVKMNGVRLNKIGELIGNLNTVIFSPDHMKIIKEGPVERRRFTDIILSQVKPGYYYNLIQYLKVLEQRNNLLNEAKINYNSLKTIDIWNEQLVFFGTKLIISRSNFIDDINKFAADTHDKISNGREKLELRYNASIDNTGKSESEIKEYFTETLNKFKDIDLRRGVTHKGPHRDDLLFFINDMEVKTYSSQGQQRTTLLSLKISELKYIESETSEMPVLLLDDVFSELDNERQNYLMNFISDVQTIITCTDIEHMDKLKAAGSKIFNVVDGKISAQSHEM
ncbi:MAG: DNA replication/repair protein RecF [Caulobacteraceae bacterium]